MSNFTVNPTELRHEIKIERQTKVKDEDNILRDVWVKLCTARAKILNTRGSEYTENYGTNSEVESTFYIRFNHKNITSNDRLVYKGKAYNIIYINNIQELNQYYEIKAKLVK